MGVAGLRSEFRSGPASEPTVIIECSPLPFKMRARGMRDGLEVVTRRASAAPRRKPSVPA